MAKIWVISFYYPNEEGYWGDYPVEHFVHRTKEGAIEHGVKLVKEYYMDEMARWHTDENWIREELSKEQCIGDYVYIGQWDVEDTDNINKVQKLYVLIDHDSCDYHLFSTRDKAINCGLDKFIKVYGKYTDREYKILTEKGKIDDWMEIKKWRVFK